MAKPARLSWRGSAPRQALCLRYRSAGSEVEEKAADAAGAVAPEGRTGALPRDARPGDSAAVGQRRQDMVEDPAGPALGGFEELFAAGSVEQVQQGVGNSGGAVAIAEINLAGHLFVTLRDRPADLSARQPHGRGQQRLAGRDGGCEGHRISGLVPEDQVEAQPA